jgi:hypothetical protein
LQEVAYKLSAFCDTYFVTCLLRYFYYLLLLPLLASY